MSDKFQFIFATRFWVMIIGGLAVYLEAKGWIGEPERNLIATMSAIFIGVYTLDRVSEKVGRTKVDAKEEIAVEKERGDKP